MKRIICFSILLLLSVTIIAQTQQGFVKTLGRPDNKGVALSGVSIRVKGEHNPVLSKDDGTFSMLLAGKGNGDAYSLQEVQKRGYELNDASVVGRQYAFSDKVPLTIVMVSTAQLQADKQRIENNAFNVAEKNYKKKLALLEKQKAESAITEDAYRKELQDLQDKFEKYQSLIDGLADHYAHVDYDELDEKEREINVCIENGELERADSLIHIVFEPLDVLKRNKEALSKIEQDEQQAKDIINQANADMAAVLKQQEKDAEYLYQLYTISLARFENDKALKYIETRAELDTLNAEWQIKAGSACGDAANYDKAILYYRRALASTQKRGLYYNLQGSVYSNIGDILCTQAHYEEALSYFEKARDFDIKIWGEGNEALVKVYNNIGLVYNKTEDHIKSMENYNKALEIESNFHPEGSESLALLNNNIGGLYSAMGKRDKAIEYVQKSLELYRRFCGEQSIEVAMAYGNLADKYSNNDNQLALQYVQKAYDIYSKMYGEWHPNVAWCYSIMGATYYFLGNEQQAENYYNKALNIYESYYGELHPSVADVYLGYSVRLTEKGDYVKATEYNQKALGAYRASYGEYHSTVASCYNYFGYILTAQDKPEEAAAYVDKAVSIMEQKYPEGHPDLYIYYLSQGTYRFGLQTHDSQNFAVGRPLDGRINDYGSEDSFNKLLTTVETFYSDDSNKIENAVKYLVNIYFIRIAVGNDVYKDKLRSLSAKYPQYVKTALEYLQNLLPQKKEN